MTTSFMTFLSYGYAIDTPGSEREVFGWIVQRLSGRVELLYTSFAQTSFRIVYILTKSRSFQLNRLSSSETFCWAGGW